MAKVSSWTHYVNTHRTNQHDQTAHMLHTIEHAHFVPSKHAKKKKHAAKHEKQLAKLSHDVRALVHSSSHAKKMVKKAKKAKKKAAHKIHHAMKKTIASATGRVITAENR